MQKTKQLNILLIITSLIGFLEWGTGNSSFLFQVEFELIHKLFTDPIAALHPFTIIPLIGQILLAITLFQNKPSKLLSYIGITCLTLLLVFMLFIGILSLNLKIIACALPFIITAVFSIINLRKVKYGK